MDLTLNNLLWLICHITKQDQSSCICFKLSAYPKGIADLTQAFTMINKITFVSSLAVHIFN